MPKQPTGTHGGVRAGSPTSTPEAEAALAERYAKVVTLRRAGLTFAQVASETGYADQSGAYRAWRAALAAIPREAADEARRLEEDRLDDLYRIARRRAATSDRALRECLRISESRRRLLGLDAPVRVTGTITSELDDEINRLVSELAGVEVSDTPAET